MVTARRADAESATGFWTVHWGPAKLIISASGSHPMGTIHDPVLWNSLIALAEQTADRLNKHADCPNCDGTSLLHGAYPCRARG